MQTPFNTPPKYDANNVNITGGSILGLTTITIPEKTPVNAVAATGTVTFTGLPNVEETVTVGDQVFTFVTARSVAGEVTVGAGEIETATNFKVAVNTDMTTVDADSTDGVVTLTAATKGIVGNSIVLTEDATNTAVSGSGTLENGVDGTVGSANEICADGSYLYYCIADNTISGTNWRQVSLGTVY